MIELLEFDHSGLTPLNLKLSGEIDLKPQVLRLTFNLKDPEQLLMDSLENRSFSANDFKRADGLWKSTCFEAFWAVPGQNSYWEFNVSAQGHWNLYSFEKYRHPQPPRPSNDFKLVGLETTCERLVADLRCTQRPAAIDAALCAVLRSRINHNHYFATKHMGPKPDFHLRQSFSLRRQLLKA